MKKMLKDNRGCKLPYDEVWELAYDNALNSGEGTGPTLKSYIDQLDDADLLQWATDEHGNFPEVTNRVQCCPYCGTKNPNTAVEWFAHSLDPQDVLNACVLTEYQCPQCCLSFWL